MKVLIDNGQGYVDYTQNVVDGTLSIEDSVNVPTLINFTLAATSNNFVVPSRSAYVRIVSERYAAGDSAGFGTGKVLATGFITNEPQRDFLGMSPKLSNFGFQQLAYKISVTSDEWLLNAKAVPFIPAYINQTQGQILANLANTLSPGFFDVTNHVASGDIVPYFQYSPDQTWSDVAKSFADSQRFRYKVIDRVVYYQPFGDQPLGISYDESKPQRTFFPLELTTNVLTVPPVNDVVVTGATEPQTNWENYFIGDGVTSQFRLLHEVFDGSTALLLQDDWTETSFQKNLWKVQDPLNVMALAGALNVNQLGSPTALNNEYILGLNGLELGGGLALQHGEFAFTDTCTGIVGGIYLNTTLTQANCVAGFNLSPSGTIQVTASGAAGIIIQPMYNGQLVGPRVVSQANHHYLLQTYIGANAWNRYERIYTNLTGTNSFGGNYLAASGAITWVITDLNIGVYATTLPGFASNAIVPQVTQYTLQQQNLPNFVVYSPINAQNLNLTVNYTVINQPPEGSLFVQSLTGATGLQLPILPQNLMPEMQYLMGFGQENQTATVLANSDTQYLAFYDVTIPGVGSRIRYQSWGAGESVSRVQDPVAVAQEAKVSGDNGIRSAVMTNLTPAPRTSGECELAAAAAIHDREYPQFQGTYTIETVPYAFETLFNPGMYSYPKSGEYFYINTQVRGVTGQNFFVNTSRIQVLDLREENLQISLDYGPDLYLEKLLQSFVQRTDSLLTPTETAPPLDPLTINLAGNFFLPSPDNARVAAIVDSLSGNYITIDLLQTPMTGCEVRRVDSGWGTQDANEIGVFSTQRFNLPRINRDQTWYLRWRNGAQISRYSKALRVNYPLIPSAPNLLASNPSSIVLGFNGDVRDIYGMELRASGGVVAIPLPITSGPTDGLYSISRGAFGQTGNTGATIGDAFALYEPLALTSQPFPGQIAFLQGDIVYFTCPNDGSFNGFRTINVTSPPNTGDYSGSTAPYVFWWFDHWKLPDASQIDGTGTNPIATAQLYFRPPVTWLGSTAVIAVGGLATITTTTNHTMQVNDIVQINLGWSTVLPSYPPGVTTHKAGPLCGLFKVLAVPAANQIKVQLSDPTDPYYIFGVASSAVKGAISPTPVAQTLSAALGAGTIIQRPVFSPADLTIDLTAPDIELVLQFIEAQSPLNRVGNLEAFFFNLQWDYSAPTIIPSFTVPAISGLSISSLAQSLNWVTTQGNPKGFRVTTQDPNTGAVFNKYTVDHPLNPQSLTQAVLSTPDFVGTRMMTVTPFDALGDGLSSTLTWMGAASGVNNNPASYTIGCTFDGTLPPNWTLVRIPVDQAIQFFTNMIPSKGVLGTAPTSTLTISIKKNGVQFATMSFAAASTVATFSAATTTTFSVGDVITVVTPNSVDATASDIGFALSATKFFG